MSEEKAPKNVAPLIDQDALAKILESTSANTAASIKELVAALLAGPQPDPKALANAETIRKSDEQVRLREKANLEAAQRNCKHMQGSHPLSEIPGLLTSIVHHRLDTGEVMGICTNCGRIWRVSDSDYIEWMTKKSGNKMSEAGRRFIQTAA